MSYTVVVDVFCDRCGDWTHGSYNRREAWKAARAQGWYKFNKEHVCPVCQGIATRCSDGTYVYKDRDENLRDS